MLKIPDEQRFPLTRQQQGLWIEWKLHPDNTSYNTCVKVKLKGDVDTEKLGQALYDIVQYFDSLKVYFIEESGVPYQCIKDEGTYFLDYQDISTPGQQETPELAQQGLDFLSKTLNTAIDLKTFPIVRASLMKVAEQTYYFIGMVPHMISDGRSAVLFLESLSVAYNHGYQGLKDAYDDSRKSWSDYYQDDKNKFDPATHALSKQYWQQRLEAANHYFDYSYGRKNAVNDKQGHRVYFDIPTELAVALKAHTGKNRTTLFNVIASAFAIFIHRYFALTDILIGFPVSIRPPGYKHLFGFFVNIIPLRIDLSGDPSYQELLSRVSKSRKQDKRHQKFPALDMVNAVRENVTDFNGQLFNLSMAQTVSRLFNLELKGVETEALESEYNDVNDDLSLSYELLDGGIGLWLEYRTSMFDKHFIDQGIEHIRNILQQVVEAPETRLSEFKLLNQRQQNELLDFAQHQKALEQSKMNLISLFEYQVLTQPAAIALHSAEQQISYSELNENANQLARRLSLLLEQNNVPIAVCLNPGIALITSLLAILKAGCHYLPLATDYPRQRLEFIIADTGCELLIYEADTKYSCQQLSKISVDYFDCLEQKQKRATPNLERNIDVQDIAYIIYTSGSTGTPKGVPVSHGNLTPCLLALQQEIPLSATDQMLQNTDFSFDVSVAEIFWPLTSGASLVLADRHQRKYPDLLLTLIEKYRVTSSCMVPSLLNALLNISQPQQFQSIRYLLAAGEVLNPKLIQKFYQYCSGKLYNFYGPTEATIYSTFYYCRQDDSRSFTAIGKPMTGTNAYILDEKFQLQPKGVAGELYLSGNSITSGYLNRPELNDNAFIDNPFGQSAGQKLYRTGDMARYLNDGNIDFLGRIDQQVKVHGYRIEISEIEIVLSSIEGISDVAIILDQQRLIAYYQQSNNIEEMAFIKSIKRYLAQQLPAYMIPALFLKLPSIPRSKSGKLQHNELPSQVNNIKCGSEFIAAETDIEKQLVSLWSSILKLPEEKIGIHDSFFDLGGDSLMAFQFASAAEAQSLYFDISTIFDSRTISELVPKISSSKKHTLSQQTIEGEVPLTTRQYQFFDDNFVYPEHWNRQFYFEVVKNISAKVLENAFAQVLKHHDGLRAQFAQQPNGDWIQTICPVTDTPTSIHCHDFNKLDDNGQQQQMKQLIELTHQAIYLNTAPLIKILYFQLTDKTGAMVIICHHLLLDMVSSRIVFEDLMKSYEYLSRGLSCVLAEKTTSLQQWTRYLHEDYQPQSFQQAINYWGKFPITPNPKLPVDGTVDKALNNEATASTVSLLISQQTTQNLLTTIPSKRGYKIQDLLLVALIKVTRNWTDDEQLMVNICGHGRHSLNPDIDLSRTVGWLNTVFPVRLDASGIGEEDTEQLIRQIHKQLSQVPAINMDYPLLRYINKHPAMTAHQTAQLFFNYVGQLDVIIPDNIAFKPTAGFQEIAAIDGRNHLCYLLYFEAGISKGQLNIRLTYSNNFFEQPLIDKLLQNFLQAIEAVVDTLTK